MAAFSEVMVHRELTIIIKVQSDQLHLFTIVIFDNCYNAYISFALQFPQSRIVGTQDTLLNAFIHVRIVKDNYHLW